MQYRIHTIMAAIKWTILLFFGMNGQLSLASEVESISPLPQWQQELLTAHPTWIAREQSSHDRRGGNGDGNPVWLYEENGWKILADAHGEGCLTRIWMTAQRYEIPWWGEIAIEIDGQDVVRGRAIDLFTGQLFLTSPTQELYPLHWPLVGDDMQSSGGYVFLAPLPFQNRMRVKMTGNPHYYQINYRQGSGASQTMSLPQWSAFYAGYRGALSLQAAAVPRDRDLTLIEGPLVLSSLGLQSNQGDFNQQSILLMNRGRVVKELPLQAFFSQNTFGQVPLDSMQSALFHADPDRKFLWTQLPIPLHEGESLVLRNAPLDLQVGKMTANLPENAPHWDPQWHDQVSPGSRFHSTMTFYESTGQTSLVHLFVSVAAHTRRWLEGDEMIRVDGLSSPFQLGTGTEDYFNGGWYFYGRHTNPLTGLVHFGAQWSRDDFEFSMYRHHVTDPIIGRWGIRFGMESGDEGDFGGARYRTLAWAYRWTERDVATRDAILSTRIVSSVGPLPLSLPLVASPDAEAHSSVQTGYVRSYRGVIELRALAPDRARFVVIRRILDGSNCQQVARVHVVGDASSESVWSFNQCNTSRRFAEDEIVLPITLQVGVHEVTVQIDSSLSPQPWSEGAYEARFLQ